MLRVPTGERVNTLTHGFGFVLSTVGAIALFWRVLLTGDAGRISGCALFALALISVYGTSTLSHAVASPQLRHRFRVLDQALIYLLIVCTFTPFALVYLRTIRWAVFFGMMWAMAIGGFLSKWWFEHRINSATVWSYMILGWMTAIPAIAIVGKLPMVGLGWVVAGGLSYTLGTIFFIKDDPRYHCHGIWHMLVLVGSSCHFIAIFLFVAS